VAGTLFASTADASLVISEINPRGAEFVELHNPTAKTVFLFGFKIVGDVKHIFSQEDVSIPPYSYLIVSHGPRQVEDAFGPTVIVGDALWGRISAGGGELRLYDPDYKLVDWVRFGRAEPGLSHQRRSSTTSYRGRLNWAQAKPTPGAANSVTSDPPPLALDHPERTPIEPSSSESTRISARVLGEAESVQLSWETLQDKGSAPMTARGADPAGGTIFAAEIPPIASETTVTYRIDVTGSAGEVSLNIEPMSGRPLRYTVRGTQVKGPIGAWRLEVAPDDLSRLLSDGGTTQAIISLPRLQDEPTRVVPGTLEARGGTGIRRWQKRSWSLRVKTGSSGLDGRREVFLRTTWRDPTHLREALGLSIYRRAGVVAPRARLVRLRINGTFLGLYTEVQAVSPGFLDRNGLAGARLYGARQPRGSGSPPSLCDGRALGPLLDYQVAWEGSDHSVLRDFVEGLNACSNDEVEAYLRKHVDVSGYASYLAVTALIGHWDNTNRNFFWAQDRLGSGKWSVIPWDLDRTFGDHYHGRWLVFDEPLLLGTELAPVRWSGKSTFNRLRSRFLGIPAFQRDYLDALRRLLASAFEPRALDKEIAELVRDTTPWVLKDRARWPLTYSKVDGREVKKTFTPFHVARGGQHLRRYVRERARFVSRVCATDGLGLSTLPGDERRTQVLREFGSLLLLLVVLGGIAVRRTLKRAKP
jgi:hypothetical protein